MKIAQIRLREQGKVMLFNPNNVAFVLHDVVIVESERGNDYGQVIAGAEEFKGEKPEDTPKKVVRIATPEDMEQVKKNKQDVRNVFETASKKILERKLLMKLVAAEYSFDRSKVIFYFTAEGRVDFRELVRDLAHMFKARIELKQIGVRDEVKMFGGYGCCGRELCCAAYLKDFEPVTIRMAKQQNMPLNPEKISGVCGRLMCCLSYEYETYKEFSKGLPKEGSYIQTKEGKGRVISVNTLKQEVIVELEDERKIEVSFKGKKAKCHGKCNNGKNENNGNKK